VSREALRAWREALGLSYRDLWKRTGVDPTTWNAWELGRRGNRPNSKQGSVIPRWVALVMYNLALQDGKRLPQVDSDLSYLPEADLVYYATEEEELGGSD
jgi:transcriptional regulator with XRE-family HTH domain